MSLRAQSKTKKASGGGRGSRAVANINTDGYGDEGSDDENAISLAAIKNKYKRPGNGPSQKCKFNRRLRIHIVFFEKRSKMLKL